ncbi:hypothetical protein PENTCL1PPCAC_9944 [Pristionchus entomophagus]|uniref:RING-type domain-containing protein n=1 Tax=Pristionchus entomophagus TaxID=358040 RepID=A0AAV5SXY2_9BILA|nr:hypothetical protein PENTCL1PPCAC_9944 [Pristionchus entomophagus]
MSSLRRSSRLAEKEGPNQGLQYPQGATEEKAGGKKKERKRKKKEQERVEEVADTVDVKTKEEHEDDKIEVQVEAVIVLVEERKDDEEELCSVCMEARSDKRLITISPCSHVVHRSCGLRWLETRDSHLEQCCPLCRGRVRILIDKSRPNDWRYVYLQDLGTIDYDVFPYGPFGQPTKYGILNHPRNIEQGYLNRILSNLSSRTSDSITDLKTELAEAKEAKKGKVFILDITEELTKLRKRARILADMKRLHKRGGMRLIEVDEVEVEWNYARELAALNIQ